MSPVAHTEIFELSVAERIQLVEDIWDSIVAAPASLPLTDNQRQELDRRLDSLAEAPEQGVTWEVARARITADKVAE